MIESAGNFSKTYDFHSSDKSIFVCLKPSVRFQTFIIFHTHLKVPVGGGPGSHELSAGSGEEAVNVAPQLTGLEPATVQFLPPISGLGFHPKVHIRVLQLRQQVYNKRNFFQILAHYA